MRRFSKLNRCSNLNKHDFRWVRCEHDEVVTKSTKKNVCMITMQHFKSMARLLYILFVVKVFGDSSGFSTFSSVSRVWYGGTNYRGGSMIGSVPFILLSGMVHIGLNSPADGLRKLKCIVETYSW